MLEYRRKQIEVVSFPHTHHRVADLRKELALDLLHHARALLVNTAVDEPVEVDRTQIVVLDGRCELAKRMGVCDLSVLHHYGRFGNGEFRDGRDSRGVRASGEHYLFAERLALALPGEGGILRLEIFKCGTALVGVDVSHKSARVVRRPVVAVDEARLHAVRLELLEKDGVRVGPVDAHSRADQALLDLVLDGGRARLENRVEVPEARRLLCARGSLDGLARTKRVLVKACVTLLTELVDRRADTARGGGRQVLGSTARRKVDVLEWLVLQFLEHRLPLVVGQLEHLRRGGDLAVHLAYEAVLADGNEA